MRNFRTVRVQGASYPTSVASRIVRVVACFPCPEIAKGAGVARLRNDSDEYE